MDNKDSEDPRNTVSRGDLRRSLTRVTAAGCLGTAFYTIIGCPAQTDFFRAVGASDFFFGLLSGIPMVMLFLQFVGAILANRVRRRKPWFMLFNICGRIAFLPVVLLPLIFPHAPPALLLNIMLAVIIFGAALQNMSPPLWYSWMADLIPSRIINTYWGHRQRWTQLTWVVVFIGVAAYAFFVTIPVTFAYPILAALAVTAGVIDIMMFLKVKEPPNLTMRSRPVLSELLEPLRHRDYKTFIFFWCWWSFVVMIGAAFMQLYILKHLLVPVWQTTLLWCVMALTSALAARRWGRIADRHGNKPVMTLCLIFKPLVVLIYCFTTPENGLAVLIPMLVFDGIWNAGMDVSVNGYMMRIAPRENRSMFVAAITGIAGLCGGLGAIFGGWLLHIIPSTLPAFGREWSDFHVIFFLSFVLRVSAAYFSRFVSEPHSSGQLVVATEFMGEVPILRWVPQGINTIVRRAMGKSEVEK